MDDRIRDRRRSIIRQQGRRRVGLVFIAVLVVVAAVLFVWLRSSDVFAVRRITATATASVTQSQISQATSSALGVSLLRVSTKSIEEKLAALPYVRSVEVYRDFPNTLEVRLVEYQPVARLRTGSGAVWLVSEDGRVLAEATSASLASLPLVVPSSPVSPAAGDQLPRAIAQALPLVTLLGANGTESGLKGSLPSVKEVDISAAGEIVLGMNGGPELRLGDPTGLQRKLTVAGAIIQQCLRDGKQLQYVDVSAPERPAVKAK
jgi:cell division protein FtsQ